MPMTEGIDPTKIEQSGWGVIFAHDADPQLREALSPLLEFRKSQAMRRGEFYREYSGREGYRPGESKREFLARHGVGPGPADPNKVPYYLLIVADPSTIPFRFQLQLDVQYAVGRLWFDAPDREIKLAQYALSVVAAETGEVRLPKKAVFFGVENDDDLATHLSTTQLVMPLANELDTDSGDWEIDQVLGRAATKDRLSSILAGDDSPALFFSASHGIGFREEGARKWHDQGALVCQDWPGPVEWRKPLLPSQFFSADDVFDDARVLGMISYIFASYGAGTSALDNMDPSRDVKAFRTSRRQFLARLPQRLLSHPRGGALAVIGHIDRVCGFSFQGSRASKQRHVIQAALTRLMHGYPAGAAVERFNEMYAELSADLADIREEIKFGAKINERDVVGMWTAQSDCRSCIVVGDPAVRLSLADTREEVRRAEIQSLASHRSEPDSKSNEAKEQDQEVPPEIYPEYADRVGYDPEFLGKGELAVPLPQLSSTQLNDASVHQNARTDQPRMKLDYQHFSIVMNGVRRLAYFAAVNIDGQRRHLIPRKNAKWIFDLRIPKSDQLNNDVFRSSRFDRSRLVKRLLPAWGETEEDALLGCNDTSHWTNCCPLHQNVNRLHVVWSEAEHYVFENERSIDKLTVFAGPVFRQDDPLFRDVQIPREYWKVLVFKGKDGLSAMALLLNQDSFVRSIVEGTEEPSKGLLHQVSVRYIEALTGFDFGHLKDMRGPRWEFDVPEDTRGPIQ